MAICATVRRLDFIGRDDYKPSAGWVRWLEEWTYQRMFLSPFST
jgi:hypothetical protein